MKTILIFFGELILVAGNVVGQTIYTADNNPGAIGGVNVFTGSIAQTNR